MFTGCITENLVVQELLVLVRVKLNAWLFYGGMKARDKEGKSVKRAVPSC